MQVKKTDLPKSQIELTVELSVEEFTPYFDKGAEKISQNVKIEGFRPGKVPAEVLKAKIGEMSILEEAANIAIRKTIDEILEKNTMGRQPVGQPQVNITKLAPANPLEYKVIVSVLPTVALGKYKGLNLKAEEAKVTDEELEKSLEDLRDMRAQEKAVDREAQNGDKVTVDIHLSLDKVPLEDGHHHDLAILLGKDYFVPGFDKKIVGAKKGETRSFELPYPDDHHMKNLAGKMVDFEVKVKEVYSRELPELNDDFAVFFRLKDLAELKKNLRESLLHEKKHRVDSRNEAEMLSKIVDDAVFGEVPEILIDSEVKNMMSELEQSIERQGGKFEDYLQHLKKDRGALMLEMVPSALKRVKSALAMRELAIVEKISPSDEEVKVKAENLKKQYADNKDILKMIDEPGYFAYLKNIMTNEKVIEKLKEWNYASTGAKQES